MAQGLGVSVADDVLSKMSKLYWDNGKKMETAIMGLYGV